MTSEEYFEESIKILARLIYKNHMIFVGPDEYPYIQHYCCKYCGKGQHKGDTEMVYSDEPIWRERLCKNKKYFKHNLDCPVLIAKDFLRGEL